MGSWWKNIGPGTLIAAAFIGPGTVTLCTLAGVNFGFALLWTMIFAIIATIVLQEMAARLGIISGKGLATVIRESIPSRGLRNLAILLVLSAIVIGNLAYEAGNISGGVLGLELLVSDPTIVIGGRSINYLSGLIGVLAFGLLYRGSYKLIERSLVFLVIIMSFAFVLTAILTRPSISAILEGLFWPSWPEESLLTIIGLIGTTVVPYNLFLHASLVKEKWHGPEDLKKAQIDTWVSIVLGGLVSLAIIIAAAAINEGEVKNAADLARGLEPLFGSFAKYFLAMGLFAAGITSAITAPLAAAYVAQGCFGWEKDLRAPRFRLVWMVILILGVVFSSLGIKSIEIIKFAQVANGILLPIVAGFLLWIMNKASVLGAAKNSWQQNVLGALIVGVTLFLGLKSILKVLGMM